MQLVHNFRNRHEGRHDPERLTPKVGVGSRHNHSDAAISERGTHLDHAGVQELGFIHRDNDRVGIHLSQYLRRRVHGHRFNG